MTEVEVTIAIIAELRKGLSAYGFDWVRVATLNQPTKQGIEKDALYLYVKQTKPHGWQSRRYNINEDKTDAGHVERQIYESTAQVTAIIDDSGDVQYTSGDVAALSQRIMNSLTFQETMRSKGVGVQRVGTITLLPIVDESDNYAIEASYDINFTYTQSIAPKTGVIDRFTTDGLTRI